MHCFKKQIRFAVFLAALTAFPFFAHAESVSLRSDDARWIANMIFQNECGLRTDCLTTWNEGEDFLSLGIGHFIWYPQGRADRYRESFPELIQDFKKHGREVPNWLQSWVQNGPPWKTREEFLSKQSDEDAVRLRQFLKETMGEQAMFMIRRFQAAILQMIQTTPPAQRSVLVEKIITLTQTRNGLYAMIDYLNFKGDGLSAEERYRAHGWGLFQVFYEMSWPANSGGAEAEFVEAARRVLRRRVDNAPSERQEDRWIQGWENRVKTYSSDNSTYFSATEENTSGTIALSDPADAFEVLNLRDFSTSG